MIVLFEMLIVVNFLLELLPKSDDTYLRIFTSYFVVEKFSVNGRIRDTSELSEVK